MPNIANILCPVDRSPMSRRALEYAAALASRYHARLRVLEVVDTAMPPVPGTASPVYCLTPEARHDVQTDLERFARDAAGTPTVDARLVEGQVVPEILREAEELRADLLVMGTHGRSGFERLVLGSVTEKILHKAPCPVLTIPPHEAGPIGAPGVGFRTIVAATDFSAAAADGVRFACTFSGDVGATLVALHVVEWPFGDPSRELQPPAMRELQHSLEHDAARRLREAVLPLIECRTEEVVAIGRPADEILRAADARRADLIVFGLRGRNAASLVVLGSTAHRVIRLARQPVLTVRAWGQTRGRPQA